MRIEIVRGFRFLLPEDGKVLTDGEVYSDGVFLADIATEADWQEVDPPEETEGEIGTEEAT